MSQTRTHLVDFSSTSPVLKIGILASRMCLAMERFLNIKDYRIPAREVFDDAVRFFHDSQNGIPSSVISLNTTMVAPSLLTNALEQLKAAGQISSDVTPQQFSDNAITSLTRLADNPSEVPTSEKEKLSHFFVSLERIAGKSVAYSNSYNQR